MHWLAKGGPEPKAHRPTVAILGGGVAGASAATHLAERGFDVSVFEARDVLGGKARSIDVPGTSGDRQLPLPGEHGFRFFPGFYRHVTDTMSHIPYEGQADGVLGNLVPATEVLLANGDRRDSVLAARFPRSIHEAVEGLKDLLSADLGIPGGELRYFAQRMLLLVTSCRQRRLAEYEKVPWWDFIGASTRSRAYQEYLAEGLTRSIVALDAKWGSTRTVGDVWIQLFGGMVTPGKATDRLLNGPTNDVWLDPWRRFLERSGIKLNLGTKVEALQCADGRISGVTVVDGSGNRREVQADVYVLAVPVEVAAKLISPEMKQLDPGLARLEQLQVQWMNGIQFFLKQDVPLAHGHTLYVDTPWALTSISQNQFWRTPVTAFGNGQVHGVLSVDISDWNVPGILYGKAAKDCTREEIEQEVLAQLRRSLAPSGADRSLADDNIFTWFMDEDIQWPNPSHAVNAEPLLVNVAGSWDLRPDASTHIPNLKLAADYVRTNTDVACMEAADEAARRAVNSILDDVHSRAPRCRIFQPKEPGIFAIARAIDFLRFKLGLPQLGLAALGPPPSVGAPTQVFPTVEELVSGRAP